MLPFKVENCIHDMFQHARTGDCAFFSDMPDQEHGHTTAFRQLAQACRTFAHLRDRTRG